MPWDDSQENWGELLINLRLLQGKVHSMQEESIRLHETIRLLNHQIDILAAQVKRIYDKE